MQLRLKLNTSEEKLKRPSWFLKQLRESTKEFNTSPLKLKLFTILRETTTFLPPPKPELNIWEYKDKPLLEELLLLVDTKPTPPEPNKAKSSTLEPNKAKPTVESNKEAELELEPPTLPATTLPNLPPLLTKLAAILLNLPPLPTKPLDTFNPELLLLLPTNKEDTWLAEVESDKEDTLLEAVELEEEPHTFQAATSSPATIPPPTIDPQ